MRVLVVEDCRALADLIAEGLSDQGIAADVADDGLAAVGKLALHRYDVIVLDRSLPGVPGDTLCQMIGAGEDPPMVLMLSAAASARERVEGLRLGADDYLVKPFHFPELVLRVRALARRQPRAAPRTLRHGGVELDTVRHLVSRDGRPLELSAKEFAVLEVLMRSDRAIVGAEELLERVWDEHANPFTNTVLVTVSRLRRKLGDPPIIETVPRAGYRMTAVPAPSSASFELIPALSPGASASRAWR